MRKKHCLFMFLLLGTLFTACKKSDMAYESNFEKSFKTWTEFKASSNNSYRYQINTSSWTGYSTETIITVKDGKVVKRSYVSKSMGNPPSNQLVIHEEWTEEGTTLNTHASGAKTMTLDEVYEKAKTDWLLKRKDAKTSFETNNSGMISSCGYIENNCADDCFRGITIASIQKLP